MASNDEQNAISAELTEEEILAFAAASRSVTGEINNKTDRKMIFHRYEMKGGIMVTPPTEEIPPGGTGHFYAESDGFATGTEGYVYYRIEGVSGLVAMYFNNPYFGRNKYDIHTPRGYNGFFTGGNGNNATVKYTISNA